MTARNIAVAGLVTLVLAGCTTNDSYSPNTGIGTVVGAVAGGLIGSSVAGNRVAGAIAGAAIGGLLGGAFGSALDEQDRRRAFAAESEALEYGQSGSAVGWRNPDSGRYGNVVPGPAYAAQGRNCREYTHTIYISGQPQVARGRACRNPDGTWTPIS